MEVTREELIQHLKTIGFIIAHETDAYIAMVNKRLYIEINIWKGIKKEGWFQDQIQYRNTNPRLVASIKWWAKLAEISLTETSIQKGERNV